MLNLLQRELQSQQEQDTYTVSYIGYVSRIPIRYIFKVPYMLPYGLQKSKVRKDEFVVRLHNFATAGIIQPTERSQAKLLMTDVRVVEIPSESRNARKHMDDRPEKHHVLLLPYGWGSATGYVLLGYRNYVLAQKEMYITKGGQHSYNHLFD